MVATNGDLFRSFFINHASDYVAHRDPQLFGASFQPFQLDQSEIDGPALFGARGRLRKN